MVRGAAALVVVLVVITLVASATASTNVPASNVGSSKQTLAVAQLAPGPCGTLALTALVVGSGPFTTAASGALVLGSAGTDTITASGSGNCIVAGGGTNTVVGTATDVCVTGPTLNVGSPCPTGPSPTTTTTTTVPKANGVTVTAAGDNYNNYGGQERLTVTNTSAISAMSVVITVAHTTGVSFSSQANSFPTGFLIQSTTTSARSITYTYVLTTGDSIPAKYPSGVIYAQYGGTGAAHTMSGDTWSVTTTSKGTVATLTGVF
jgi:hypothetical protein